MNPHLKSWINTINTHPKRYTETSFDLFSGPRNLPRASVWFVQELKRMPRLVLRQENVVAYFWIFDDKLLTDFKDFPWSQLIQRTQDVDWVPDGQIATSEQDLLPPQPLQCGERRGQGKMGQGLNKPRFQGWNSLQFLFEVMRDESRNVMGKCSDRSILRIKWDKVTIKCRNFHVDLFEFKDIRDKICCKSIYKPTWTGK